MWPILVLAAAVTLVGCSRSEEKSEKPQPLPPPPEKDQPYRRSCLTDASCPEVERQASVYDYVGAVYGEKGRVTFGKPGDLQALTVAEKSYVLKTFGTYKVGETEAYLKNAHSVFFRNLKIPAEPFCDKKGFAPETFSNPLLGSAVVLHGQHGCGQNYSESLLQSGIELSLAADPKPWRFYLEAWDKYSKLPVKLAEMELFKSIGQTLGIPIANPLPFNATTPEGLAAAAKISKYKPEDFAAAIVFQLANMETRKNPGLQPIPLFTAIIKQLAPPLNLEESKLFETTRLFLREYDTMQGQAEESDRRIKILAEATNNLNQAALERDLPKVAEGKSLFIVGSNHLNLVKQTYEAKK